MLNFKLKLICVLDKDNKAQGASEMLLLIGGVLVVVLILAHIYKSYLIDLTSDLSSNEIKSLNSSFSNLSSKFN